jgi:hypothetical protein
MNTLFLDDSEGRIRSFRRRLPSAHIVEDAQSTIEMLAKTEHFDRVFLDHDLGGQTMVSTDEPNTGSEVVRWIVANKPSIGLVVVHSMNIAAAPGMVANLTDAGYTACRIPFIVLMQHIDVFLEGSHEEAIRTAEYFERISRIG